MIAYLSINALKNPFDLLVSQIEDNLDILMISEIKLGANIPIGHLRIGNIHIRFGTSI